MKNIIIIAGAIGTGKTTILKRLVDSLSLDDYELISTDLYLSEFFLNNSNSIEVLYAKASCFSKYKMNKALIASKNIIWETVVAKDTKIETIKRFKALNYSITCFFVTVDRIEICIDRVRERNKCMPYSVDIEKVINRYYKSLEYLDYLEELVDNLFVINNSCIPVIRSYKIKDKRFFGGLINDL